MHLIVVRAELSPQKHAFLCAYVKSEASYASNSGECCTLNASALKQALLCAHSACKSAMHQIWRTFDAFSTQEHAPHIQKQQTPF